MTINFGRYEMKDEGRFDEMMSGLAEKLGHDRAYVGFGGDIAVVHVSDSDGLAFVVAVSSEYLKKF